MLWPPSKGFEPVSDAIANYPRLILEKNGSYYFSAGWHIKGVYSLLLGFIFSASTIWNSDLMFLQSYSWIIGAIVSYFVYYLLAKE